LPQSPELAGGAGFTYEGNVAAFYMSCLLAEAYGPGISDKIVSGVSVQQRDFEEPLDDVIVDFRSATGDLARLSLQVKQSLTISSAKSNTDFREVIRDSWATLNKNGFRIGMDRYGVAVGTVSAARARALNNLCEMTRASLTAEHFSSRFGRRGNASAELKTLNRDVANLLKAAKGSRTTDEELHRFLSHFVFIKFDFLHEGASDPPDAINRIRDGLLPSDSAKAPLIWSHLVSLARSSAGVSGQFSRPRLQPAIWSACRGSPEITDRHPKRRF
jgi:hypothetical protein